MTTARISEQFGSDFIDAWNSHDVEEVASFYASNYEGTDVGDPDTHNGLDGIRNMAKRYFLAFPDLHLVRDETVIEGDRVAISWEVQATHLGRLMNIPPTNKKVAVRGISLLTLEEGKVRRALYVWDVAGLLRAIGLLPDLSA